MLSSLRRIAGLGAIALAVAAGVIVGSTSASAQETTTVPVGDIYFCDESFQNGTCETTISAGDTVVWDFSGADLPHTTTSTEGLWDSDIINDGSTFQFTFDQAGTYAYQCSVHPTQMQGTIVVQEAEGPTNGEQPTDGEQPTEPADTTEDPAATTAPDTIAPTGTGPGNDSGSSTAWWVFALIGAGAAAVIGAGGLAYQRTRS